MTTKTYHHILLAFLQLCIVTSLFLDTHSVVQAAASPGLVAEYGFEEGSGTTLSDSSGNSNAGTLTNGPVWVTTGKYGKALRFDGVNDLVSIPDSNSLDLTTGMTLEAWVNPSSTPTGWDTVVFKGISSGLSYSLYGNGASNHPYAYITSNGVETGTGGGSTLPINTWTHLAATYDGLVIRLYVNGTQVSTLSYTGTIQTSSQGVSIGGNTVWTNEGFLGMIDEVRIYNRALTVGEIATDMQTPVAGTITPSPSPTRTITAIPTRTSTATSGVTAGPSLTASATRTPSQTPSRTPTRTPSQTPSSTTTRTPSQTPSLTSTAIYTNAQYTYPLKRSANQRYFVDQNNTPFFINGDTPWSLIGQVSKEDAELYLQDAANKGVNSIIVTLTESYYANNAPRNFYNDTPFTPPNKFTGPNEAYFAHADWVINKAAQYGIQVILAPNYLGCCTDGWWDELMNNNSVADAAWFGTYVGNRYKNFPNIMYVWGNDINPCGVNSTSTSCTQRDKIRAMAQAVSAADPNHLQTYHGSPEFSALDVFNPTSDPWLTANITYTYQPVQIKTLQDYNRTPIMPFFLFESHYEADFANALPIQVRRQAYVAVLSGAAGQHYGNNPIWHMNGKPGDASTNWKLHLNDQARADLPHIRALFESRAWYNLVPDQTHSVITAEFGSNTGNDYVGAARTSDGSTVIAYIPSQKQITLDMTKISGSSAIAWWFNPRNGTAQLIGSYPTTGTRNFTPSTNEDWVLVLDNATLNLSAPGSVLASTPTPLPSLTPTPSNTPTITPTFAQTDTPTDTPTVIPSDTSTATLPPPATDTPVETPISSETPGESATPTDTPTETPIPSETSTLLPTDTGTATPIPASTYTATETPLPSYTPTDTPTDLPSSTPTALPTSTASPTPSLTATPTNSFTPIPSSTSTATDTATPSPTATTLPTSTSTATSSPTATALPTSTATATPSFTATPTNSFTPIPSSTATNTSTPSSTATALPTSTSTSSFTPSPSATATSTNTSTPSSTATALPANTSTQTPSLPASQTPTATRSSTPTASATATRTSTPTASRTPTPTRSATPTASRTATPTRTFTATSTTVSTTGLVASYNFNTVSGTTLTDGSGNNNNGTLTNGPTWTTSGRYGSALSFDGINDKVVVPDSNSLDLTNRITLEAWVYPSAAMSGWDTILMKEQPPSNLLYVLYANGDNNRPYGHIYINGEQDVQGTATLPINTWSHVAMTYDGVTLRFYINGQLVASRAQTGSLAATTGVLSIGGNSIWTNETFAGRIDEIRIYNRVLTQQELQTDMNTPIN